MSSEDRRHVYGQHSEHDEHGVRRDETDVTVELREEELTARKLQTQRGQVSVGTEIVEERQTLEVPVTREEVTIERRAVDRQPSDRPIAGDADEAISVPVREEQVLLEKQPVVYEEVNVGKRAIQENERVSDTVRKEVVDVDATGNVSLDDENRKRR